MPRMETNPIYVKHITTNKPIYHYVHSIDMKQNTSNQMDDGLNVFQIVSRNARQLGTDGIQQRQFVEQSMRLMLADKIPYDYSRKYLNIIAREGKTNLKQKNVTRACQALGEYGF